MPRPIVLIGLPGAGKSTVAPIAAAQLGAPWCDLDEQIVAAAGRPIVEIFAQLGEPRFRQLERDAMERAITAAPQVIAAGGGWAAEPGNLAAVGTRAFIIYMSLTPAEAAARLGDTKGRPLLAGVPLEVRLAELLAARETWYRLADIEIVVGRATPDAVAGGVVTAARQYGGW